jgi:hypothetical protein
VLSCRYSRRVARDNTVRLGPRIIQIPPGPGGRSSAGVRVEVRELLDGRVLVFYQTVLLVTQLAPRGPFSLVPRAHPAEARARTRRPRRSPAAALRQAVHELGRALRSPRPATAPTPPPSANERADASRHDDQVGGRHHPIPSNHAMGPADGRRRSSTPVPTHPWRQPFSPRERDRQRTRREG